MTAEEFRRQKPTSTDPDYLERMARGVETRRGTVKVADMPGDGPWSLCHWAGQVIASSPACGTFRLEGDKWSEIKPDYEKKP